MTEEDKAATPPVVDVTHLKSAPAAIPGMRYPRAIGKDGVVITDFAGTAHGGVFAVYGEHLDTAGQLKINGSAPEITAVRPHVIKGRLYAPGVTWEAGPVTVEIGGAVLHATL